MNKPNKIHAIGAKPAPLTEDEIKAKQAMFFMQKRETFAQGILYNLTNNAASFSTAIAEPEVLVEKAVQMADLLLDKLYEPKTAEE